MGQPNVGQALQLMSVLANNTDWSQFSPDSLQAIIDRPQESGNQFTAFLKNGARAIVSGTPFAVNSYPVTVDYSRSVEAGVAAGKYDWSSDDIISKNFPTNRTGVADLEIQLVHFNRATEFDDAIREIDRFGLRPAELHELLSLGEKYPKVQREFPVVALGSVWRDPDGDRLVAFLCRFGSRRNLRLYWTGFRWDEDCRFAAVRK